MKTFLISILLLSSSMAQQALAQELNCKVSIRHDRILNVDKQVFVDMERNIANFINTRKWTTDEYATGEKIDCTIMFNLTARLDGMDDAYEATMNIQATQANFKFNQFSPLVFDDNRVTSSGDAATDNLAATLAYYIYIILGLDYDSYALNGGNIYYKKAQNIVNNAPEGKGVGGWKATESTKNRFWLVEQMLNPRFTEFHKYWYNSFSTPKAPNSSTSLPICPSPTVKNTSPYYPKPT